MNSHSCDQTLKHIIGGHSGLLKDMVWNALKEPKEVHNVAIVSTSQDTHPEYHPGITLVSPKYEMSIAQN